MNILYIELVAGVVVILLGVFVFYYLIKNKCYKKINLHNILLFIVGILFFAYGANLLIPNVKPSEESEPSKKNPETIEEGGCCTCKDCPMCDVCCDCSNPYMNK